MSSKLIKNNCRIANKKRIVYSFLCFFWLDVLVFISKKTLLFNKNVNVGDGELKRKIKVNSY
jgi:hypothetical protein